MAITRIQISRLTLDGKTQQRDVDPDCTVEYAEAMRGGAVFPPIEVVSDGKSNWVTDGYHRVEATRATGKATIRANVKKGTIDDAIWASFGANKAHGIRREPGVARRIITKILTSKKWSRKSLTEIAKHVGVSQPYVSIVKQELSKSKTPQGITVIPKRSATIEVKRKGKIVEQKSQEVKTKEQIEDEIERKEIFDEDGNPIPLNLEAVWRDAEELKNLIRELKRFRRAVTKAVDERPGFSKLSLSAFRSDIGRALADLTAATPYIVCPYCGAKQSSKCTACKTTGFLSKIQAIAVPDDIRKK